MLNNKINISYVRKCTCKSQKSFYQQYFAIRSKGTLKGDGHNFGQFFFYFNVNGASVRHF